MSRFTAPSDLDYYGEQDHRLIRCADPECDQQAEQEGWLCPDCQRADAAQAERERQERLRADAFRRGVSKGAA